MTEKKLQKGDIIRIEKGMRIYTEVPENMIYTNKPFSTRKVITEIKVGEIYYRPVVSKESIIYQIMRAISSIVEAKEEQIKIFVDSLNLDFEEKSFNTSKYEGEYIVDFVVDRSDEYTILCSKKDEPSIKIRLYID